ncbi:hypothetical protein OOP60_005139 [Salmonella enterica]|uniref:Uncharacterized protein n=4 Tax=Salmonella enterica TaxID=28901 RepID=A0A7Z1PLV0_SALET|nr:hypothetical protein [Salmonella enterica]EBR9314853.1 hypothetical protein [Salmonella enterica subsp. enterica serovar Muenchen]EBY9434051.1 hypothetical protein [Salmonella enterica subsp. enterica serovar Cerro]ECA3795214.1 hypothetical protein [Salmonella enterica subsp. enterica serovar Aqua]EEJ6656861.1 hypothetical protein [Salmonella enterica subsp. enterica serovar Redlands]ESG55767.1 hypothetical protein SEEM1594_27707 [Salmonella enterica subsp. enterica serovar Muenchen str. ba
MRLKYSTAEVTEKGEDGVLFDSLPQSAPVTGRAQAVLLQQLINQLRARLSGEVKITCHPHRIGHRGSVALTLEGESGRVDLLITVNGRTLFPEEEEYTSAPRWYIDVVDAVDAVYLMLTLNSGLTA